MFGRRCVLFVRHHNLNTEFNFYEKTVGLVSRSFVDERFGFCVFHENVHVYYIYTLVKHNKRALGALTNRVILTKWRFTLIYFYTQNLVSPLLRETPWPVTNRLTQFVEAAVRAIKNVYTWNMYDVCHCEKYSFESLLYLVTDFTV